LHDNITCLEVDFKRAGTNKFFTHLCVSQCNSLDTHQLVFTYRYSSDCSNDIMLPSY